MKTILTAFALFTCLAWKQGVVAQEPTMSVYFADNFDGDTVSFIFNGWLVFDSRILITDKSTGSTGSVVYLSPVPKNNYFITYSGDTTKSKVHNLNEISGVITINGQRNKVQFDFSKGKYVLINETKAKDENDNWKYGVTIKPTGKKPGFE